jgi:hypothetical protein
MKALFRVTAWERVSLWRRIPCAFVRVALAIALLSFLITLLGPLIGIQLMARRIAQQIPGVNSAPRRLVDYSISDGPQATVAYFGYQFEIPWGTSVEQKVLGNGLVELEAGSGHSVIFIVPTNQSGLLTEFVRSQPPHLDSSQSIFGELMNRSAYDQYAALLNTTPKSIHAFGSRAEAVRGSTLLMLKSIAFPSEIETGVFSFELPDKRGFQIGDPRKSKRVDLEVFGKGGYYVEMMLFASKGGTTLSQPDINFILKNLHEVPTVPSDASSAHSGISPK